MLNIELDLLMDLDQKLDQDLDLDLGADLELDNNLCLQLDTLKPTKSNQITTISNQSIIKVITGLGIN